MKNNIRDLGGLRGLRALKPLKGSHFKTVDEGQKVTPTVLNNLKENNFRKCFNSKKQRRNSRTAAEGTTKKIIWVQCFL
jgi:hypothetical protein